MKFFRLCLLAVFLLADSQLPMTDARAQVDLYPFPEIEDLKTKKAEPRPVDPFAQALSAKMNVPERTITDAVEKGFGRTELIRLILISKKSGKALGDLLKEREKGARLAKIAESVHLNNRSIREEAESILKELEAEEKRIRLEMERSSGTMAGVSDALTKDGTHYEILNSTAAANPPNKKK
jgi:hypothetical protein